MTIINININISGPTETPSPAVTEWETPLAVGQVWEISADEVYLKEHVIRIVSSLSDSHVSYEYATLNSKGKLVAHRYVKRCLISSFDTWRRNTNAKLTHVYSAKKPDFLTLGKEFLDGLLG